MQLGAWSVVLEYIVVHRLDIVITEVSALTLRLVIGLE